MRLRNKNALVTKRIFVIPRHLSAPPAEFPGPLYGTVEAGGQTKWPVDTRDEWPESPSNFCSLNLDFIQILDIEKASALARRRRARKTFRGLAESRTVAAPRPKGQVAVPTAFVPKILINQRV
jgi:hypothetical protein